MEILYQSNGIEGRCIKFLENDDETQDFAFRMKPSGRPVQGTLTLLNFEDRPYQRLTFHDSKNVMNSAVKDAWGTFSAYREDNSLLAAVKSLRILSRNSLCCFDFSRDERENGRKLLRIELQPSVLFYACALTCYDFLSHKGTTYLLPDKETASGWGKALGIPQAHYFDENGKLDSMVDL